MIAHRPVRTSPSSQPSRRDRAVATCRTPRQGAIPRATADTSRRDSGWPRPQARKASSTAPVRTANKPGASRPIDVFPSTAPFGTGGVWFSPKAGRHGVFALHRDRTRAARCSRPGARSRRTASRIGGARNRMAAEGGIFPPRGACPVGGLTAGSARHCDTSWRQLVDAGMTTQSLRLHKAESQGAMKISRERARDTTSDAYRAFPPRITPCRRPPHRNRRPKPRLPSTGSKPGDLDNRRGRT